MLLRINKLKNFGVYQNFDWGSLDDFKNKNLIYGWNYSGKTTISKLFQILEYRYKNICFPRAEFEIAEGLEGLPTKIFTQDTINTFPFTVKVFNSEYFNKA